MSSKISFPGELESVRCALCGHSASDVMYRFGQVMVVKCRNCELMYTNPRPTEAVLKRLYEESYYDRWWYHKSSGRQAMWRRRLKILNQCAPEKGRLLDVGTGIGDFLELAQEDGWEVYGTEISSHAAALASQAVGVEIHHGELVDAHYLHRFFDVITFWHVLEHLLDPLAYLREAHRILKPTGALVIAVPNMNDILYSPWKNPLTSYRQVFSREEPHLFHFTADTLRKMLEAAGFKICFVTTDPLGAGPTRTIFDHAATALEKMLGKLVGRAILACAAKTHLHVLEE
jgi:2-polyprenyl-3-methyl-5-hydroxy-6-metoxy-1,4-benzoquinol methylase